MDISCDYFLIFISRKQVPRQNPANYFGDYSAENTHLACYYPKKISKSHVVLVEIELPWELDQLAKKGHTQKSRNILLGMG